MKPTHLLFGLGTSKLGLPTDRWGPFVSFFSFFPTHNAISAPTAGSEFPPAPARRSRPPAGVTRLPEKDRAWSSSREQYRAWSSSRAHGAHARAWRGTGPRPPKPEVASHTPELASPVRASPSSSSRAHTQGWSPLGCPHPLDLEGWESRGYARNIPHCDVPVPLWLRAKHATKEVHHIPS